MSKLGALFRRRREERGLRVSQLAKLVWPHRKGCVRIHSLEKNGVVHPPLLAKLAEVLGIPEHEYMLLLRADEQDRLRAWEAWANQPIIPYFVVRLMAAVYSDTPLPESIQTLEDAEAFVSLRAAQLRLRCCLVWSRKVCVYFAANGTVDAVVEAAPGHDPAPQGGLRRFRIP